LYNNTQNDQTVSIAIQTPLKENKLSKSGLRFFKLPARQIFFRGTVRLRYKEQGKWQNKFIHLVQKRGEMGESLATLNIKPGNTSLVQVDLIYPPDATPPQVLTVSTQVK
jgi:hypothetical protein